MAILVTRPAPDNARTAQALQARGYDVVLAPMLQWEAVRFTLDAASDFTGIILTSVNAVRALERHPARDRLIGLPAFAVGERTAEAARHAGFSDVVVAEGDSAALRDVIVRQFKAPRRAGRAGAPLLYLSGENVSRDLSGELETRGIATLAKIAYRMTPVMDFDAAAEALLAGRLEAVLHYSTRSARVFVDASRRAGHEIAALSLPQGCLSPAIAAVLREAGAGRTFIAGRPEEDALFESLDRILPAGAGARRR